MRTLTRTETRTRTRISSLWFFSFSMGFINETQIMVFKRIQCSSHNQCTFTNNDLEPEMCGSQQMFKNHLFVPQGLN